MTKLTDNSPMPWGKHQQVKMANVPADYLLHMYENNKCDAQVKAYVEENMDVLRKEVADARN